MKLMSRNQKFLVDNYRVFAIIGFETNEVGLTARYLRLFLKPYEQRLDKECKAHCISITRNLEKDDSFEDIAEDLTKESIVGAVVHYIKSNLIDIIANVQPDKLVKLNTDPYKKVK